MKMSSLVGNSATYSVYCYQREYVDIYSTLAMLNIYIYRERVATQHPLLLLLYNKDAGS